MIPQRIQLKGFLCYKDEQEVNFDNNATLWMLSGLNGSGKSSIFDAVTYALFGHHRGGSQHAIELINKDSDGLAIEFDFRRDNDVHRIRRTLRRTARGAPTATQQIYRYDPSASKNPWVAVEGTNYKREFDSWIGEKIGLTYETFTSSVLLLQGKADKLLDSKPEGRRAVLASIVDLERYERLHERADEKRKALSRTLESLSDRLAATPEVKAEQIGEAEENIRQAEEIRKQAGEEVDRLRDLEHQAKGWMDLQGRLATVRQRWERARILLEDAAGIERDAERFRELRDVLPRLFDIVRLRGDIHKAEVETKNLTALKQKAIDHLNERESALKQERDKRTSLQNLIGGAETRQRELNEQLIAVTAQMEKLKEYERHATELTSIQGELAPLPRDPMSEVVRARETCEALAVLVQLTPRLTHFQTCREKLRQALADKEKAERKKTQVEAKGKQASDEVKRLEPLVEAADAATRQASERATEEKTRLQQAKDSLREITVLDNSGVGRHCGQPLTASHLEDEQRKRKAEVERAEGRLKKASTDLQAAQKAEKQQREQFANAQKTYQEARDEFREGINQLKQAQADVARYQGDCAQIYGELPESYQQRISPRVPADWLGTEHTQDSGSCLAGQRKATARRITARPRRCTPPTHRSRREQQGARQRTDLQASFSQGH
jgi:DNA repair protein SbcC/Rad50